MASADELRRAIVVNRGRFRESLAAATGDWETGDDGGWTKRRAAEHCIGRDMELTAMTALAMDAIAPASYEVNLGSSSSAAKALQVAADAADTVYRNVQDRDLAKPAPLGGGAPSSRNIEGVMVRAAWHFNDHADQILKA